MYGDATINEGNSGTALVTVWITLASAATEVTTVQWATGPGSALSPGDFVAATGTVSFALGETTKSFTVAVVGDTLVEGDETFSVTLSNASGATVINDGLGVVTIVDNDVAPTVPTVTVAATSGAEGGSPVVITLTRTGSTAGTLAISVITGGTASAGDVGAPAIAGGTWSGSVVTFNSGSSTVTITYSVVNDTTVESTETLTMTLASGTGYTVGSPSSATANIVDNDAAPTLPTITMAATSGAEGASPVVITLSRTGATTGQLSVTVSVGGTASSSDLNAPTVAGGSWNGTNTVTFALGSSTVTLTFGVVNDLDVEALETFAMTLVPGSLYTVGSPSSAGAYITDNDVAPQPATLAVGDATVVEGNNGGPTVFATITVTRTGDTSGTSSVNWTTVAGTAVAGSDYFAASGSVTFTAGQTSRTITVQISSDKKAEPTETFTVVLSGAAGATIADGTGVVTITDNDGAIFAASAGPSSSVTPITDADVAAILPIAIQQWVTAGASADHLARLRFVIGDLPGTKLADTLGSTITIDADAAGWGWNLAPGAPNPDRIDLLSVLLHEVGHVLGYEHTITGLMAGEIEAGTELWSTFQAAVTVVPALTHVVSVDQAAVAAELAVSAVEHASRAAQPVAGAVAQSADAVERMVGSIVSAADPAVRKLASRIDIGPAQLSNGTTNPSNVPLAPTLLVAFGILTLLRRRRVV